MTELRGYELIVAELRNRGRVSEDANQARTKCPAHQGAKAGTLAVYRKSDPERGEYGKSVCYPGCAEIDVLAALGLSWRDRFDNPVHRTGMRNAEPVRRMREPEPPKSVVDRPLQRLLALPDLGERICRCVAAQRPELYIAEREGLFDHDE